MALVVVAVSFLCAQEVKNAIVAMAVIKQKKDIFIELLIGRPQSGESPRQVQAINGSASTNFRLCALLFVTRDLSQPTSFLAFCSLWQHELDRLFGKAH